MLNEKPQALQKTVLKASSASKPKDEDPIISQSEAIKTESKLASAQTKNNDNSYADTFISTASNIQSRHPKTNTLDPVLSVSTNIHDDSSIKTSINDLKLEDDTHKDTSNRSSSSGTSLSENLSSASTSTSSSVRDLEIKVKELKNEYLMKRNEAEKLGRILKEAEKVKMKDKEEQLRRKIDSYDKKLENIKSVLNNKEKASNSKKVPIVVEGEDSIASESSNKQFDQSIDISTKKIELDEQTSSSSSKTSSVATKPDQKQYEDDFVSEKPNKPVEALQAKVVEEDTVSEISEDILLNSDLNQDEKSAKNRNDSGDMSTSSNSSTDTQILLLGSARTHKPVNNEFKHEKIIYSIEKSLLGQEIELMVDVREQKTSKLLAEQYKESIEQELDYEDKTDDLKIHIPSIDLSDEDHNNNNTKNETAKIPVMNIPFTREKVSHLCDIAVESFYWEKLDDLKSIIESNYLDESLIAEPELEQYFRPCCDPVTEENQSVDGLEEINFKKMLFDLIGELLYDLYLEKYESAEQISEFLPGLKRLPKKKHFKSVMRGPGDLELVKEMIRGKVCTMLKIKDDKAPVTSGGKRVSVKSKWRVQKKLDLVDTLLDLEMREQEYEWSNYESEEYEAKLHITNTIFDLLLKDTIESFQHSFLLKIKNNC